VYNQGIQAQWVLNNHKWYLVHWDHANIFLVETPLHQKAPPFVKSQIDGAD